MMRIIKGFLVAAAAFVAARMTTRRRTIVRWKTEREPIIPTSGPEIKRYVLRLAFLLPVLAVGGFLVAASGIISIKASTGHWAITEWFLQFSKSRSIATHAMGMTAPPLDEPMLVLKGAGHFETGCLPCHGGPEREHPRIARQMTPLPPLLSTIVPNRSPEELFYVVKHGIKMTGMPAWPAQTRDDEVWAIVAFLRELPDMDGDTYRALVYGHDDDESAPEGEALGARGDDVAALEMDVIAQGEDDASSNDDDVSPPDAAVDQDGGDLGDEANGETDIDTTLGESAGLEGLIYPEDIPAAVSDRCGRCHGVDGSGRDLAAFPRLAGQRPQYLYAALRAYAEGDRRSGIMQPVAAELGDEEMRRIALYYSRLSTSSAAPPFGSDAEAVERGEQIARQGVAHERVPACAGCHGPDEHPKNPFYPILAGQFAEYIELQLELFKDERRGGSAYAGLMHPTADDLTEGQMREVALYYSSLGTELTETELSPPDTTR